MELFRSLAYFLITVGLLQFFSHPVKYDDLALKKCWQSDWSIHGWWPETNTTSWPQFCDPRRYGEFNATMLMDALGSRMKQHWSPCPEWKLDPVQFWRHEWEKHGTCTPDTMLEYFGRTLDVFEAAQSKQWYGCCGKSDGSSTGQCLLHFNKTSDRWLGVC